MHDIVQVVAMLRPDVPHAIAQEIAAIGFPFHRATSPIAAASKAVESPTLLFCDAQSYGEMTRSLGPGLLTAARDGKLRTFVVGGADQEGVVAVGKDASLEAFIDAVAPKCWLNRRAAPRAEVALAATFGELNGVVKTLSESGASFTTQQPPPMGAKATLVLSGLTLSATVVNERRFEKSVGLKFDVSTAEMREALRALVTHALASTQTADRVSRVLVFDAGALATRMTQTLLEGAGFLVTSTRDAAELAQRLVKEPFDLVFLDPGSLGTRLQEIRRRIGQVPFVLHASGEPAALKQLATQHGAADWIRKGTFGDLLLARLAGLNLATVANPNPVKPPPALAPPPAAARVASEPVLDASKSQVRSEPSPFEPNLGPPETSETESAPAPAKKKERYDTNKLLAIERSRQKRLQITAAVIVVTLIAVAIYFLSKK